VRRSASTRLLIAVLLLWSALVGGCSTIEVARAGPGQKHDPWENWNRKVFDFNEGLDQAVLKPVATAYVDVVPRFVRVGVTNFFNNFADAWSAVNNLLQFKIELALQDVVRVGTNTVFGLGGFIDVAGEMGIDHHYEDFGQTLGHWGFGPGAYVVWPLFGPSSVRETIALPLDRSVSPAVTLNNGSAQAGITVLQLVNTRAGLLGATRIVDEIALDKYSFVRDAYLQRRRSLRYDGDAPPRPDPEDDPAMVPDKK
jgi:phospholipid-binding lipoprotein MlaA